MSTTRTTRVSGLTGAVGGIALVTLAVLQMADRAGDTADTILSGTGFLGMAVLLIGLLRIDAAPSRLGRTGLILWIVGVLAIVAGGLAEQTLGLTEDANWLYPIGGLGQLAGGLMAGTSIARAGTLDGWVRWAPLGWAVVYAVMVPFGFTDSLASAAVFALFGVVVTITSLGLLGSAPKRTAADPVPTGATQSVRR